MYSQGFDDVSCSAGWIVHLSGSVRTETMLDLINSGESVVWHNATLRYRSRVRRYIASCWKPYGPGILEGLYQTLL